MDRNKLRELVVKVSEGIFSEVVDILLWEITYLGASSTTFDRNTWQARIEADRFLDRVNYETIKNALARARKKGLIKASKHKRSWPEITKEGKGRLEKIMPQYDAKRMWDKRVYLITYDIPEEKKNSRELLRTFLKRFGAGIIQDSVWLTPYNPEDVLKDFIKERSLSGNILISDIGADGSIGNEDLKTLIARIYKLDELNKEYKEFIDKCKNSNNIDRIQSIFSYMSILRLDPQLPFTLLPEDWWGDEAYRLYLRISTK